MNSINTLFFAWLGIVSSIPASALDPNQPLREEWRSALRNDQTLVKLMNAAARTDDELDRWAETIEDLVKDHQDRISEAQQLELCRPPWEKVVRAQWLDTVVMPTIVVPSKTVEQEYQRARSEGLDRAPGVKVLEIFLWAPEDLPVQRSEALDLARAIQTEATDPTRFATAAEQHSSATSYFKGGRIGTLHSDQLKDPLRSLLFTGSTGPTEPLETPDGVYLFYIASIVPPKNHDPATVRCRIERTLKRNKLRQILPERIEALETELEARLVATAPGSLDDPIFRIGERTFRFIDVLPTDALHDDDVGTKIRRAYEVELMAEDLRRKGLVAPTVDGPACTLALAHALIDISARQQAEAAAAEGLSPPRPSAPAPPETWSFDLLVVSPVTDQKTWLTIMRAANPKVPDRDPTDLSGVARRVEELDADLETRLVPYRDVSPRAVAFLGPEIHSSLRRFLEPGERSTVMHLAAKSEAVVVSLIDRSRASTGAVPAPSRATTTPSIGRIRAESYRRLLEVSPGAE